MNLNDIREESGGDSSTTDRLAETEQDVMATCMFGLAALYLGQESVAVDVGHWLQRGRWAGEIDPSNTFTCPRTHLPPIKGDGDGTTDCKSGGTAMDRAALD